MLSYLWKWVSVNVTVFLCLDVSVSQCACVAVCPFYDVFSVSWCVCVTVCVCCWGGGEVVVVENDIFVLYLWKWIKLGKVEGCVQVHSSAGDAV